MLSLILLGLLSLVVSLASTPIVGAIAQRLGLVDKPDAHRKFHAGPVPRVGGISIAFAYVLSLGILLHSHTGGAQVMQEGLPLLCKFLPAAALVFATGLVDDIAGLRPWQKLMGQVGASLLVYELGIRITTVPSIREASPSLAWWSCPLTVLWLLLCMNAFNLIDGLDGLASGLSLVSATTVLMVAIYQGDIALALAIVPLVGALFGFLRFNINPAKIFLGDCGSLSVGFMLGCSAIVWSAKSATLLGMAAPLLAVCVPLIDTVLAISRRFLRYQPIFQGDRGHIHHRLLELGLSTREVAFALSGTATLAAIVAISLTSQQHGVILILIFIVGAWIGIHKLGYVEFAVAGEMMTDFAVPRMAKSRILLKQLEARLAASETIDECWTLLSDYRQQFGFLDISARLGDKTYRGSGPDCGLRAWRLEIPLSSSDCVWLTRALRPDAPHEGCLPFADLIRKILEPKLRSLRIAESRPRPLIEQWAVQT